MDSGILDHAYQENSKAHLASVMAASALHRFFLHPLSGPSHTPIDSTVGLPLSPSSSWWFLSEELSWVDPGTLLKVKIQCFHPFMLHRIADQRHWPFSISSSRLQHVDWNWPVNRLDPLDGSIPNSSPGRGIEFLIFLSSFFFHEFSLECRWL